MSLMCITVPSKNFDIWIEMELLENGKNEIEETKKNKKKN